MPNKKAKQRCPECGSTQIYNRVLTEDYRCQKCGYIGKNGVK